LFGRSGNQRPLYGLVAADSDEASGLYKNMDELVAASLFAMRQIQPHGPYALIGESLGGKLAYEIARVLEKEGERIALLALLDAPFRGSGAQDGSSDGNPLQRLFKGLRGKSGGQEAHLAAYGLQSNKDSAHLAQRRYLEILTKFEPSKSYPLPTLALFTRQYEDHRPRWEKVLPAIKVTIVEGAHEDYLRVSGDKVVGLLRQAMDGTPTPQKKAFKFR
jgi:thioesterase domain-containing protein